MKPLISGTIKVDTLNRALDLKLKDKNSWINNLYTFDIPWKDVLDVSTNPPKFWKIETLQVRRPYSLISIASKNNAKFNETSQNGNLNFNVAWCIANSICLVACKLCRITLHLANIKCITGLTAPQLSSLPLTFFGLNTCYIHWRTFWTARSSRKTVLNRALDRKLTKPQQLILK